MTGSPPHLSPTAGLFNALLRHLNCRLTARLTELRGLIAAETELAHTYRTARDFRASEAAGYIDRTGLENTK